jgi:hypothetical protein
LTSAILITSIFYTKKAKNLDLKEITYDFANYVEISMLEAVGIGSSLIDKI